MLSNGHLTDGFSFLFAENYCTSETDHILAVMWWLMMEINLFFDEITVCTKAFLNIVSHPLHSTAPVELRASTRACQIVDV